MISLEEKAFKWMQENKESVQLFYKFAIHACRNANLIGAKCVSERVRFESMTAWRGKYKWNNNYTAYVARQFIKDYPQYAGKIRFREVAR